MKLISWNINGLRSIFRKDFKAFVKQQKPDIICLQETKIGRGQFKPEDFAINDYDLFLSGGIKKGYSGVATYVRNGVHHRKKDNVLGIGARTFDDEGRFLISHHKDFVLYNCYFPSGSSGDLRQKFKYKFLDTLYKHISKLPKSTRNKLVICGDYNICHREIDIHHPKEAQKRELSGFLPKEREWMDRFSELGFVDSYRHHHGDKKGAYSWWTYRAGAREKNLGWRIDYLFCAKPLSKKISGSNILTRVKGSDHCPIVLEFDF